METDRELLELAAKAAGIDWFDEPAAKQGKGLHMKHGPFWNPLADDGDALRLAVKLKFSVSVFDDAVGIGYKTGNDGKYNEYPIENCSSAATRRAITRAAAQIQESKESK